MTGRRRDWHGHRLFALPRALPPGRAREGADRPKRAKAPVETTSPTATNDAPPEAER